MKPGDLVYDTRNSYEHGIILEKVDADWFGGAEDIYKVFFAVESRTYFVLRSNLRKVVQDELQ